MHPREFPTETVAKILTSHPKTIKMRTLISKGVTSASEDEYIITEILRPLTPDDSNTILPESDGILYTFRVSQLSKQLQASILIFNRNNNMMEERSQFVDLVWTQMDNGDYDFETSVLAEKRQEFDYIDEYEEAFPRFRNEAKHLHPWQQRLHSVIFRRHLQDVYHKDGYYGL